MKNWLVYIAHCADGTLYTGSTNNLEHRLAAHNQGLGAKYTRSRRPVKMVYQQQCNDKSAALKREHEIKQLSREKKLLLIKQPTS